MGIVQAEEEDTEEEDKKKRTERRFSFVFPKSSLYCFPSNIRFICIIKFWVLYTITQFFLSTISLYFSRSTSLSFSFTSFGKYFCIICMTSKSKLLESAF